MNTVAAVFLFTDIQGSTARWERSHDAMGAAVRRHDELMSAAISSSRGRVFKTMGDQFCAIFPSAFDAVAAALAAQRALASEDWSAVDGIEVRMAIHTGGVEERDGDYFGRPLNRVARLLNIGHGGQVLLSGAAAEVLRDGLPAGVTSSYLGQHRLKDLEGFEHIYQVLAPGLREAFPPLRSVEHVANNLPVQLTSFVGRRGDLTYLRKQLEATRLLTLVGTGGVGKTRLVLEVASESLDHFPGGVTLIDLSDTTNAAVDVEAASALAVRVSGSRNVVEAITAAIGDKKMLLIFDACEHVVTAAAMLVGAIIRACPRTSIVCTSRQALEIEGEIVYNVGTLPIPPAGTDRASTASEYSAVRLFVERSKARSSRVSLTDDTAATISDICRRLDGIPLALELAAAKTAVLSLKALCEKLDERFRLLSGTNNQHSARHQTLRALIDWSFDLLDERERAALRRLSIFAGGWTLQAAAAVCSVDDIDEWEVFELLGALIAKSLVVVESDGVEQRYDMLNSIREYGRERLHVSDEADAIAARHARYYADFVCTHSSLVESLDDEQWQRALAPEIDNLRAVIDWAIRTKDADVALTVLAQMEWPELVTAPQEAVRWFDAAAELIEARADDVLKARLLRHFERLQWLVGHPIARREETATRALAVARAASDPNEIARALAVLASCHRDAGRFEKAEPLFVEAYREPQTLGAGAVTAVLRNWAVTNLQCGDVDAARRRFMHVADLERPGSEAHASALLNLGELEFAVGNVEAARGAASLAKETFARLGAAPLALGLCNLAAYAMAVDDIAEARASLEEALKLLQRSGARWMVTALEHHAVLAGLLGDHDRAAALLGFTDAHYTVDAVRQRTEQHGYERLTRLLAEVFDPAELARRTNAGARLKQEQALEYAAAILQHTERAPVTVLAD